MVSPAPTEEDLVERARAGDADAYAALVREHERIAFRTAMLVCGDAAEAEEAAQDAFVKAYRALGRFRSGEPLRPWLLTIVANEARNRRRAAGRRSSLALRAAGDERLHAVSAQGDPDAELLAHDQRRLLLAALGRLREEDRLVIGARYLLELSETEAAAALGVPAGTVKSRLSRALGRLREEMGPDA